MKFIAQCNLPAAREDHYQTDGDYDAGRAQYAQPPQREFLRPGTSLGIRGDVPARRITIEEKDRQAMEMRADYKSK